MAVKSEYRLPTWRTLPVGSTGVVLAIIEMVGE